ncbi:MAG: thioredoxin domain-containing protein [Inhella sp.]|jgi:thioredoxin 1|uniref:thioredoxin domain-containing protein n=1 Tax=Inhella sp. TaxID=1921806 RepID=UPI0022C3D03E|nr:protein disulfide isomerase family protein [Inhella sp.]MCZ8236005.1 protein disulfide isomerase family protein [Inhella sp.]
MSQSPWRLACLCAAWCRACEAYRPIFEATAAELGLANQWVDVEDSADRLGDLDIQTFPTVLLFNDHALLFAGPVLPDAATLQRLVRHAIESATPEPEGMYAECLAGLRAPTEGPEAG